MTICISGSVSGRSVAFGSFVARESLDYRIRCSISKSRHLSTALPPVAGLRKLAWLQCTRDSISARSSLLFRMHRRSWDCLKHPLRKPGLTAPQGTLLPGPTDLPQFQQVVENIVSFCNQWVHGSLMWDGPIQSCLMENVPFLAPKFVNSLGFLFSEGKEVVPTQAVELVNNICSDILSMVSNLSGSPVLVQLNDSMSAILHRLDTLNELIGMRISHIATEASGDRVSLALWQIMAQIGTALGFSYDSLPTDLAPMRRADFVTVAGSAAAGSALFLAASNERSSKGDFVEVSDLPLLYDPDAIAAYFKKRPADVITRSTAIIYECSAFATNLLIDLSVGLVKERERIRAAQLVEIIAKLGPTAIKIGQALSIRPDVLPAAYLEELQKLQDRVPPFPNEEAVRLILECLDRSIEEVFSEISAEPVAAASLGQVYKARLRETGQLVAVKVQRPGILESISRDLYLLRHAARAVQSLQIVQSNLVDLLDSWAYRFFDELDYVQEARNTMRFAEDMKSLPNITVPEVYMDYTSRKVLMTKWVEGEKLFESNTDDLLQLVKTALNCYLMQLLETGFLHADPHPGNLLRTPNGCLCILDFGLMTEVTEDQRYAFIDYISHLVNSDFPRVADDLVKLGFIPSEQVDPEKTMAMIPQLSRIMTQLVQGGGARKLNMEQIIQDLSNVTENYAIVIPPYFALIFRAFSVLQGIGLEADPDYAIIDDCYPYLSKRLIADDSPRARAALKYFLYSGKEQLDVARMEDLISGCQTFQELTTIPIPGNSKKLQSQADLSTKQFLHHLFAPEGSYVQELLLAEIVRAVDALSRNAMAELWHHLVSRLPISLPAPLLASKSWPIFLPGLLFGSNPVATLSEEDEQSLRTVKRLLVLVEQQFTQKVPAAEVTFSVMLLIPDLFPGMVNATHRFMLMLLQRQALRLADDLDGEKSAGNWDRNPTAFAHQFRFTGLLQQHRLRTVGRT